MGYGVYRFGRVELFHAGSPALVQEFFDQLRTSESNWTCSEHALSPDRQTCESWPQRRLVGRPAGCDCSSRRINNLVCQPVS